MRVSAEAQVLAWLRIVRIQFYPMTCIAYSLGAVAAHVTRGTLNWRIFWIGYAVLFLMELCSVLTNEYFDYDTDRANHNASPFTGGSRVLVDGSLTRLQVRRAIVPALGLLAALGYVLLSTLAGENRIPVLMLLAAGVVLGLGYTAPPLKLCYRGMGELVVGLTHSSYMILAGYMFQSGKWTDSLPWLLSIPLFFAVFSAITMAGIPDRVADRSVAKNTLVVILGPRAASTLGLTAGALAVISTVIVFRTWGPLGRLAFWALCAIAAHWLFYATAVFRLVRSDHFDRRIDGILILGLSFIVWFGVLPLAEIMRR